MATALLSVEPQSPQDVSLDNYPDTGGYQECEAHYVFTSAGHKRPS